MTLSDYVELNPRVTLLRGANVPFVSMDIISPGTRKVYPVQERPASGSGSKFGPGDTLFARITPCLENGKIAQYAGDRAGMGSTEFFVLRARDDISDPAFVYYFSQNPDLRSAAEKSMSGASGRQRAVISSLSEFECEFPPLAIQKRIASILSAYDELIENSQRRIKILEAMARGLYREWFVHFRFPGHENHPRVVSALGEIPEGWVTLNLEALIKSHIGGGWGKDEYENGFAEPAWVIRGTDIPDARYSQFKGVPHRFHSASNLRSRRLKAGDIVFEVSGGSKGQPVGRALLITSELLNGLEGDVICASFCKRIEPDPEQVGSELLYLSFVEGYESGEIEQYQVQSTGISNFKWTEYIANTQRAVPPKALQTQFRKQIAPMFRQIATIGLTIQNLRRTRDLLLPRLLSGQINVEA